MGSWSECTDLQWQIAVMEHREPAVLIYKAHLMSWLGMFQVTRFGTSLSLQWLLSEVETADQQRGILCSYRFKEMGCSHAPVHLQVAEWHPLRFLCLEFWGWEHVGMYRRCVLYQKSPSPNLMFMGVWSLSVFLLLSKLGAATAPTPINPFQVNQPQPLTLNQMRASPVMGTSPSFSAVPPMSMEPIPLSSMAPVPVGMAPIPAMGTVASLTRMGQGLNVSIAGSMTQPLHSTGIPPSASQSTNTTNPFLL